MLMRSRKSIVFLGKMRAQFVHVYSDFKVNKSNEEGLIVFILAL